MSFLKQIFTWWNKQTTGTFIYTLFTGRFVGQDQFGNKYYSNYKKKRWVIYKDTVESTKIPPEWHAWLHHTTDEPLTEESTIARSWQKNHEKNLTGTSQAYRPLGHAYKGGVRAAATGDYQPWQPK